MSIILPGQENLSKQQLQAAAQKQELLSMLSVWKEFLKAEDIETILETQVGKDLSKGGLPTEAIEKIWRGGKLIELEQTTGAKEAGAFADPERITATAAQICSILIGIVSGALNIVGTPIFRGTLLAFQVGILSVQEQPTLSENPEVSIIESAII